MWDEWIAVLRPSGSRNRVPQRPRGFGPGIQAFLKKVKGCFKEVLFHLFPALRTEMYANGQGDLEHPWPPNTPPEAAQTRDCTAIVGLSCKQQLAGNR